MAARVRGKFRHMTPIPRLLSNALYLAVDVVRTAKALVEYAAETAVGELRGRRSGANGSSAPRTPPPASPPPRAPARPARAARPAPTASAPPPPPVPAPGPPPPSAPIAMVPEPTPGQAARARTRRREAEQTADSPGPEIHVDEPWPGYRAMKAPEIIDRLVAADAAVKAVVLLYEGSHRKRKTVLRAVEP
jgi:hypothetical protein